MDNGVPFEVGYEKAKAEILAAIASINRKYRIPTSLLNIMLNELSLSAKVDMYEAILGTYDISTPEAIKKPDDKPDQVISMDGSKVD